MKYSINIKELNEAVSSNKEVRRVMEQYAVVKLEESKTQLVSDFETHPVSIEIAAGPSAPNLSKTLGGYGNLFSFIGFDAGSNPVSQWSAFIRDRVRIKKNSGRKVNDNGKSGFEMSFDILQPIESDFTSKASMPWESGRSWLTAIERGISGFSYYIVGRLGRSGGGIQASNKIRSSTFSRTNYWSGIWKNFVKNIGGK